MSNRKEAILLTVWTTSLLILATSVAEAAAPKVRVRIVDGVGSVMVRGFDLRFQSVNREDLKIQQASALRTLDQYRSKFPGGALDQEATVLRIEALDQRGDHAQAASMARAFLARNPASAHAKRLERIAGQ